MYLKGICFLFVTVLWVHNVNALPRDSSVIKTEPLSGNQNVISPKVKDPSEESGTVNSPFLVSCEFNESTKEPGEDVHCQEHCLRKGYSYGLCWQGKCSCI